jgi:hypothetical protein
VEKYKLDKKNSKEKCEELESIIGGENRNIEYLLF